MRQVEAGRRSRKSARSPEESNLEAGTKNSKSPRSPEESKAKRLGSRPEDSGKAPGAPRRAISRVGLES